VRIPGHTGWILGSYLYDMFQSWHSSFVAMMQLKNHTLQPCLTVGIYEIFKLFFLTLIIAPDGSNQSLFHRQCSRSSLLMKCRRFCLNHLSTSWFFIIGFNSPSFFCRLLSIGCTTSAPDGSSPRGYIRICSGIG
jgi:hypothetical protein